MEEFCSLKGGVNYDELGIWNDGRSRHIWSVFLSDRLDRSDSFGSLALETNPEKIVFWEYLKRMSVLKFIFSIGFCFSVAFLGSVLTLPSIPTWYAALNKPIFSPPNWIFGPVWTILYFLMGISLYIIWNKNLKSKKKDQAIKTFIFQLVLNLLWSLVFFGLHQSLLAFITVITLWISIFMTIKYFYKISRFAAYLLIPYILWVSFAAVLNLFIVLLN